MFKILPLKLNPINTSEHFFPVVWWLAHRITNLNLSGSVPTMIKTFLRSISIESIQL